jgi:rhodanese-related sulfurtransferase
MKRRPGRNDPGYGLRRELIAVLLLAAAALFPAGVLAGHGVEDTVDNLPAERVKQLLDAGEKLVFVDLRPSKDFQQSRLPGARSIPVEELPRRFSEVPKSGRVVLYCECKHAEVADRAVFLEHRGYRNIFVMPEGFSGWARRGFPLDSTRR